MNLLKTIKHNYLEILPPAIFFFIAFTLILITKRLILSEYGISWTGFSAAFVGAMDNYLCAQNKNIYARKAGLLSVLIQ